MARESHLLTPLLRRTPRQETFPSSRRSAGGRASVEPILDHNANGSQFKREAGIIGSISNIPVQLLAAV